MSCTPFPLVSVYWYSVHSGFPNASCEAMPADAPYRPPASSTIIWKPLMSVASGLAGSSAGRSGALLMGKLSSNTRIEIWAVGIGHL